MIGVALVMGMIYALRLVLQYEAGATPVHRPRAAEGDRGSVNPCQHRVGVA